jgi:deazaflavin-dependent oxidoreductase (nitroreductase family)
MIAHAAEASTDRYLAPDWFSRKVFNPLVARSTALGLSVKGSRLLELPGRTTGELRTTVVNLLTIDGQQYLVAPRGTTQWVRNLRAAGSGTLRVGHRRQQFVAAELADDAKTDVLRAYLEEWAWEVGRFFDGLTATSPDAELATASPGFPVFRVEICEPSGRN